MHTNENIQAIAFDLDGTLVDSLPGLALAIQSTLQDLHLPTVTNEQVKNWVGNGVDVLLQRALSAVNGSASHQAQAKTLFNHHYDHVIDEGTKLFPHVLSTMQILHDNNYPMALVTNKPKQFLPSLLSALGIEQYFSLVLGGGDVVKLKPHPAPLYQVMATFGVFHDQLLFVGDSKNDIQAAKNANSITAGLTYGYNYGEPIENSKPDFVFDRFEDILTIIPLPKREPKK